jgi:hypothetical protein
LHSGATFIVPAKEEVDISEKQNFLDTPMSFARANYISNVPLGLGLGFGRTIFIMPIIFVGGTFAFFVAIFPEALAFYFFVAAAKALVPGIGRGA